MSYVKPRDWVEDFADENGNYANECFVCKNTFRGHKRRVTCKLCTVNGQPIESEQAQAIADIKEKIERYGRDSNLLILAMPQAILLTEIVDSQAQRIARLEYTVSDKSDMLTGVAGLHKEACEEIEKQAQKISEQAKEIESLNALMFQHMSSETYNHCQEYLKKMRG